MSRTRPAWPRSRDGVPDRGFTLIELLVVMIIIGLLASIAIPVFLRQRQKAQDSATLADLSKMGKEVTTFYVSNSGAPTVALVSGHFQVNGADVGVASANVQFGTAATPSTSAVTTGWADGAWCLGMTNLQGRLKDYKFSAQNGLETGSCASPTAP